MERGPGDYEQLREPTTAESATPQDVANFNSRAVYEMVSAFGGNTGALRREERLRRQARLIEEERLRVQAENATVPAWVDSLRVDPDELLTEDEPDDLDLTVYGDEGEDDEDGTDERGAYLRGLHW